MDKAEIIAEIREKVDKLNGENVIAVYLFGSVADGKNDSMSDIDVCVVDLNLSWKSKVKIMNLFGEEYDISFFSDVPVWIKMRVLKGIPIVVNDKGRLFDISFSTLEDYEDFKPLLCARMIRRFGKCTI